MQPRLQQCSREKYKDVDGFHVSTTNSRDYFLHGIVVFNTMHNNNMIHYKVQPRIELVTMKYLS